MDLEHRRRHGGATIILARCRLADGVGPIRRRRLALSPNNPSRSTAVPGVPIGTGSVTHGLGSSPVLRPPGSAYYLGLTAGAQTISQVLTEALEAGQSSTAVAALEILSQIGGREQLLSQQGLKSPLLSALNSPDTRVQFAAATTILKLEPKTGFSGASRIVSILTRAVTDPGIPRAIVIDTDGARGSTTAAFLADGGFEGVPATTGREGFELASNSAGVQVIVVQVNCQRWDLTQTLANLRGDARTAAIPIVIYGPSTLKGEMARLVARTAPATFVAESASASDFLGQFLPFVKTLRSTPPSAQERALQKETAVYWLATIASGSLAKIFDVSQAESDLAAATGDPATAKNAMIALGGIGTGSAQRRLTEIALNSTMNDAVREFAASQLAFHIQRYGLLLTRDGVVDLHNGWKQTESPTVKAALASVIGSLNPNATIVGERLRQFPIPTGEHRRPLKARLKTDCFKEQAHAIPRGLEAHS